jgi:hypothetical protein
MMSILIAVVNIAIMFRQQINIMKNKASEIVIFQWLDDPNVQQSTSIELDIVSLYTVNNQT